MLLTMFVILPTIGEASTTNAIDLPRNDRTNFSMDEKSDLTTINDANDNRVYKISLGMNPTEKLTLVSRKTFDIEITDSNGNTIVQHVGIGDEGSRQIEFPTSEIGDYYIYITPSADGRDVYPYSLRVIAGEPVYINGGSYRVDLNTSSITSSSSTSTIQTFNLSNVSSIPNDAILTAFTIGGTETNRNLVSLYSIKRSLRPNSSLSWINATYPLYNPGELDYVPKIP